MEQGKKLLFIFVYLFLFNLNLAGKDITLIFISSSMPDKSVIKILKQVDYYSKKKNKKIGVFLNGFVKENLKNTVIYIYNLMKKANTDYGSLIYPQYFEKYKITAVPVYIRIIDNITIKMTGDVGLDFFYEKSNTALKENKNQKYIDLGCWGPVYAVVEKDLETIVQEKLKNINIKDYIEKAKKNLFKNIKTVKLKTSKKDYAYFVDMSVVFNKDLYTPDGKIFYKAGTKLNPLEKLKYDEYFVFFDGKDKKQINFVKNLLKDKTKKFLLLLTDFNKSDVQALAKLRKELNHSVFIAYPYLIKKFHIKNVPSIAHQKNNLMQIKVFALLNKKNRKGKN